MISKEFQVPELLTAARDLVFDERVRAYGPVRRSQKIKPLRRGYVEVPSELWFALVNALRREELRLQQAAENAPGEVFADLAGGK